MKYISYILLLLLLFSINSATNHVIGSQSTNQVGVDVSSDRSDLQITRNLTSMPLAFTENQGQWDEKVRFRANAGGATMWFTADGAYYQFTRRVTVGQDSRDPDIDSKSQVHRAPDLQKMGGSPLAVGSEHSPDRLNYEPDSIETMMIKASFVGANPRPRMVGDEMMEYKSNYFLGNDPTQWHTDVPNYQAVVYEEVYPGIDLKYYGNGRQMEYDFIVSPGADPSQIMVQYEGTESVSINSDGELVVATKWGEVIERQPVVYQLQNGRRVSLDGRYRLMADNSFGFSVSNDYDPSLPLIIDPVLSYSTYLGGGDSDVGYSIAIDGSGCAYVTGWTLSSDFPTEDAYQNDQGNTDVFVTKLNSTGNGLVYSTYLGGNNEEYGYGIVVDGSGCAYVAGETWSSDFPTQNAYQTDQEGYDAFVTKLSGSGNSLVYSTYLGGSDSDVGYSIAIDGSNCAYITGYTWSFDFPIEDAYQTYQYGSDVFVTKLNNSGDGLVYSTYLGGESADRGYGITVDGSGCAYVTGFTWSSGFPIMDEYQTHQGEEDIFVTKLNSAGNGLVYSTYLGGNNDEYGRGIAVDVSGCAYITGCTYSSNFPTQGAYQTDQGSCDIIVTKLSSTGNSMAFSTYLGGGSDDFGLGIAVDGLGCACVTGITLSTDFPTYDEYQTNQAVYDAFVTKLNSLGNGLVYSTYMGGDDGDYGYGIAVDGSGSTYIAGLTHSSDFPTHNAYQSDQGVSDVFVTKLYEPCCQLRGDVNHDGSRDISDIVDYVSYMFHGGLAPSCLEEGDIDNNGSMDISDLTYFVSFMFAGGPEPPPCE